MYEEALDAHYTLTGHEIMRIREKGLKDGRTMALADAENAIYALPLYVNSIDMYKAILHEIQLLKRGGV